MKLIRVFVLGVMVSLYGCTSVGPISSITYEIRGRVQDNTYISPDGSFRVQIPALWKPGAKIIDGTPAPGALLVSFTDDLCREYVVSQYPGSLGQKSLQKVVEQTIIEELGPYRITVREITTVDTHYGPAVRLRYMQPGGAPCGVLQFKEGKRVDSKVDAEVAMYVFNVAGKFYRLIYFLGVGAPGLGDHVFIQRGPVQNLLERFVAGFEILDEKSK